MNERTHTRISSPFPSAGRARGVASVGMKSTVVAAVLSSLVLGGGGAADATESAVPKRCKVVSVVTDVERFPGLKAPGLPRTDGVKITTTTTTKRCGGQTVTETTRDVSYF